MGKLKSDKKLYPSKKLLPELYNLINYIYNNNWRIRQCINLLFLYSWLNTNLEFSKIKCITLHVSRQIYLVIKRNDGTVLQLESDKFFIIKL